MIPETDTHSEHANVKIETESRPGTAGRRRGSVGNPVHFRRPATPLDLILAAGAETSSAANSAMAVAVIEGLPDD